MIVFRDVAGMKCNVIQGPRISLTLHPGYELDFRLNSYKLLPAPEEYGLSRKVAKAAKVRRNEK